MSDMIATPEMLSLLMQDNNLDEDVATLLLELSTGAVQAMAGQRLVLVEDDPFELYGSTAREFILPERPVVDVSEITLDGGDPLVEGTDYIRAGKSARLFRRCGWAPCLGWPSKVAGVYSHGYAEGDQKLVPAMGAVLGLSREVAANPSGVESESIDDYRVQFSAALEALVAASDNLRYSLQRTYGTGGGPIRTLNI